MLEARLYEAHTRQRMRAFRGVALFTVRPRRPPRVTVYGRIGGTIGESVGAQSRDVSPLGDPGSGRCDWRDSCTRRVTGMPFQARLV